ncbi:unnamed protein product [Eretmochelys imbricata]
MQSWQRTGLFPALPSRCLPGVGGGKQLHHGTCSSQHSGGGFSSPRRASRRTATKTNPLDRRLLFGERHMVCCSSSGVLKPFHRAVHTLLKRSSPAGPPPASYSHSYCVATTAFV